MKTIICIGVLIDAAVRAVLFWRALHAHTGTSRLLWFLALTIPMLGTFVYLLNPPNPTASPQASPESLAWAHGVIRRSGTTLKNKDER